MMHSSASTTASQSTTQQKTGADGGVYPAAAQFCVIPENEEPITATAGRGERM